MPVPLVFCSAAAALVWLIAGCGGGGPGDGAAANEARAPSAAPKMSADASPGGPAPRTTRAAPRTGAWSATGYAFNGTEPFWGGSLTGTTIRYMVPEDQFGDVVETEASYDAARETYSGRYRGRPFVLSLTRSVCSDGMSDRRYAFTATLQVLGETRRGCADPQ